MWEKYDVRVKFSLFLLLFLFALNSECWAAHLFVKPVLRRAFLSWETTSFCPRAGLCPPRLLLRGVGTTDVEKKESLKSVYHLLKEWGEKSRHLQPAVVMTPDTDFSRAELDLTEVDVTDIVPQKVAEMYLCISGVGRASGYVRRGSHSGQNCWNAALALSELSEKLTYTSEIEFRDAMQKCRERLGDEHPQLGDIGVIRTRSSSELPEEVHAYVFLGDGLVFHKAAFGRKYPYEIIKEKDALALYKVRDELHQRLTNAEAKRKPVEITDEGVAILPNYYTYYNCEKKYELELENEMGKREIFVDLPAGKPLQPN